MTKQLRMARWLRSHAAGRRVALALATVTALAVGPGAVSVAATTRAASAPAAVSLTLPAPTGPHHIGTVSLHLVDHTRTDPWVPGNRVREIMIQIWYPASTVRGYPTAPWLSAGAVAHFEASQGLPAGAVRLPRTHGHVNAPAAPTSRPVLVYSPAFEADRGFATAQVEDLVSHGYVVVTIDHTHDASEVEFPDGRVETATITDADDETLALAVAVRAADARFVVDQLAAINAGSNPDAEHRALPRGMRGAFDLDRIAIFGHSFGGATAAAAVHDDRRFRAGVNMDGTLFGAAGPAGSDRPFLLLSSDHPTIPEDPTWDTLFAQQRGPILELRLAGSAHLSFNDGQVLYPQLAGVLGLGTADVAQLVGTIDPGRSVAIQRRYLRAFFDLWLRHRHQVLLAGPSRWYPEVQFVRCGCRVVGLVNR
jgi:predicted dienelactone hydrolase